MNCPVLLATVVINGFQTGLADALIRASVQCLIKTCFYKIFISGCNTGDRTGHILIRRL